MWVGSDKSRNQQPHPGQRDPFKVTSPEEAYTVLKSRVKWDGPWRGKELYPSSAVPAANLRSRTLIVSLLSTKECPVYRKVL